MLQLSFNQAEIGAGDSFPLILSASSGYSFDDLYWSSEDSTVASVDQNGLVRSYQSGETVIYVSTSDGQYKAQCNLIVTRSSQNQPDILNLSESFSSLTTGEKKLLEPKLAGKLLAEFKVVISDRNVISYDGKGEITALRPGKAQILVFSDDFLYAQLDVVVQSHMIPVQGMTFEMGVSGIATPIHSVALSSFQISAFEVTQMEYFQVMGENPSSTALSIGDSFPVNQVSLNDAAAYCNALSLIEGLTPCYSGKGSQLVCHFQADGYRLPTEAEWEFACTGGNLSSDYLYSGSDNVKEIGWFRDNSGDDIHPVGMMLPNELGIFDMSGNVSEWCWDFYSGYNRGFSIDPVRLKGESGRVIRGGSWKGVFDSLHRAARSQSDPSIRERYIGLRVVRTLLESLSPIRLTPYGGTFYRDQSVTIDCDSPDISLYYTLDGSDPAGDTGIPVVAGASVILTGSAELKVYGWKKGSDAVRQSASYLFKVSSVYTSPRPAVYSSPVNVVFHCSTEGAQMRYTQDNSTPSSVHGTLIEDGFSIYIEDRKSFKIYCWKDGYESKAISANYSFLLAPIQPELLNQSYPLTLQLSGDFPEGTRLAYAFLDTGDPVYAYFNSGDVFTVDQSAILSLFIDNDDFLTTFNRFYISENFLGSWMREWSYSLDKISRFFSNQSREVDEFYISLYEVIQKDFIELMGFNPSSLIRGIGDRYPVNQVSWYEAVEYCNALSLSEGLTLCYTLEYPRVHCDFTAEGYRLPTRDEWLVALNGNIYGLRGTIVPDSGWTVENSTERLHEVGQKPSNQAGLYDMEGNVREWVWDAVDDCSYFYSFWSKNNDSQWSDGKYRTSVGTCYFSEFYSFQYPQFLPDLRYRGVGFRVVRRIY